MAGFFLLLMAIYVAMNAYLWAKVSIIYPQLGRLRIALAAFQVLMIVGPILGHYLEKWHSLSVARAFSSVVYCWAVAVLWFTLLMAAGDIWNAGVRLAALHWPAAKAALLSGSLALPIIGGIIAAAMGYGFYEAQSVRVRHLDFTTPALAKGQSIRLVQVTDLHLGEHMDARRFEHIVELIRQQRPDVIISNGDLVDTSLENLRPQAALLAALEAPLGKFAVLGNHEYYNGLARSLPFHEACGFKLLRATSIMLLPHVRLAGVDDPAGLRTSQECHIDESAALAGASATDYTILLKHQPRVNEQSKQRFALQLSGHTHGGQIFPFHVFTRLVYQRYRGLYDLGGSLLYVNVGAGTWGPPLRVLAQPEVTVITLSNP